jgi:hypothetical protein
VCACPSETWGSWGRAALRFRGSCEEVECFFLSLGLVNAVVGLAKCWNVSASVAISRQALDSPLPHQHLMIQRLAQIRQTPVSIEIVRGLGARIPDARWIGPD